MKRFDAPAIAILLLLALAALVGPVLGPVARAGDFAGEPLVASAPLGESTGEHLWIVFWQPDATPFGGARAGWAKGVARLVHVPPQSLAPGAGTYRTVAEMSVRPIAIAAAGDRVWLVHAPNASFPEARDVVERRAEWNPATKLSFVLPAGGELRPSLPAAGELLGVAADHRGLWALLAPSPAARLGIQRDSERQPEERAPTLWWLRRDGWVTFELPPELAAADALVSGPDGIAVLAAASRGPGQAERTLIASPGGRDLMPSSRADPASLSIEWTTREVPVPRRAAQRPVEWIAVDGRWAMVMAEADDAALRALSYWIESPAGEGRLAPWADVRLASLAEQGGFGAVLAAGSGAIAIEATDAPASEGAQALPIVERQRIGASSAQPDEKERLNVPGFGAAYWFHVPLLMMMALGALMIFAFVRVIAAPEKARQPLPVNPLPVDRRALALLIDAVPPAAIVLLVFQLPPTELLHLPSWTIDLPRALPAVLTIIGIAIHTSISEWLTGSTLGKRALGGRVLSADGSRPTLVQAALRGAFKILVLIAPILSVLMLLQRDRRGIGDIASGTVVIDDRLPRVP